MRERMKAEPNEVVCKYLFGPAIEEDNRHSFDNMCLINMAHAMMLLKTGIIAEADAHGLLQGLMDMYERGPAALTLNPKFEDYYFNVEKSLIADIGIEIGGKLHTGRSRNDLHSTLARMNIRDAAMNLVPLLLELRSILLKLSEENKDVVLTGYTHMQPAQPISLAHYFTAVEEALSRDFDRLEAALGRLNFSSLGGGAFAGTSFPVDRDYVAGSLGFNGPILNSLDAIASRDYLLELVSAFSILGSTVNRLANDLYIWATDEFSYVEVDDSVAACSSIMPQKKNPITLEHIKAKSSHLLGAYVSVFSTLKGIPFGHCRDVGGESYRMFWNATAELEAILALLNVTLSTIKIKPENMVNRARQNFSVVTDLADELVRKQGMPFRIAHEIVGNIVRECLERGIRSDDITAGIVNDAARSVTGESIGWTEEYTRQVLAPEHSVREKRSSGSPSPEQCQLMITVLNEKLERDKKVFSGIRSSIESAKTKLKQEISEVLARK